MDENNLKNELGIEESVPIPADYKIPYFVHQDDMNKLDLSHKRVEKWMLIICIVIFLAFVGTNAWWMWYENQFADEATVTQDTPNGNNNYVGRDGDITNGTSNNN